MTRHEATENLLVALDTLRSHKVRSSLTVLGIVIGVTSVISVASIIDGLNQYVQDKVDSLGSRTFFVTRLPPGTDPNRMPLKIRIRKYIDYSDAAYLRERSEEHTSELQSRLHLVCRLLLEKKKNNY